MLWLNFIKKLAVVWAKNANIFTKFSAENHNIGPWLSTSGARRNPMYVKLAEMRSRSYDRELQRQRCNFYNATGSLVR
jgi:hypothetical protein